MSIHSLRNLRIRHYCSRNFKSSTHRWSLLRIHFQRSRRHDRIRNQIQRGSSSYSIFLLLRRSYHYPQRTIWRFQMDPLQILLRSQSWFIPHHFSILHDRTYHKWPFYLDLTRPNMLLQSNGIYFMLPLYYWDFCRGAISMPFFCRPSWFPLQKHS